MRDILISALEIPAVCSDREPGPATPFCTRGRRPGVHDVHTSNDSINARANVGSAGRPVRRASTAGLTMGENESDHPPNAARGDCGGAAGDKDGDVIWATTQESLGARFHGPAPTWHKITGKLKTISNGRAN